MNTQGALRAILGLSRLITDTYVSDMDDAELLQRSVPDANHISWQLGHLIASEHNFMEAVKAGYSPRLPEGFAERHTKETASVSDSASFCTKKEYLELYKNQRKATLEILETLSDTDLDKPAPEKIRSYCPTIGDIFVLCGGHEAMHAGQYAVLRRSLGKPILM